MIKAGGRGGLLNPICDSADRINERRWNTIESKGCQWETVQGDDTEMKPKWTAAWSAVCAQQTFNDCSLRLMYCFPPRRYEGMIIFTH